jgi:hypothetical protein
MPRERTNFMRPSLSKDGDSRAQTTEPPVPLPLSLQLSYEKACEMQSGETRKIHQFQDWLVDPCPRTGELQKLGMSGDRKFRDRPKMGGTEQICVRNYNRSGVDDG